jgi:pantetheine-phosphate adenylyltransferase
MEFMTINKKTLGLYAGSFAPFHVGHLDIVKQALQVFNEVWVARGVNPEKVAMPDSYPLPTQHIYSIGADVSYYDTLLSDYVKLLEVTYNVTLVRGLRNGADLEYEQNMIGFLKGMYPEIKVVAFYYDPQYRHISSSALRGIEKFSKEEYNKYIVSDKNYEKV